MYSQAFDTVPVVGQTIILSVTDTAARFAIPAAFAGMRCRFTMEGAKADVAFGDSTVVATYGDPSAVASEVITVDANSGMHLNYAQPERLTMPVPSVATHFSVDCIGSGSGKLNISIVGPG